MIRIIVNLGIKTVKNNNNSSLQHTHIKKSFIMRIVDTPKNYLSNVDSKYDMRKVRTSSMNLTSIVFMLNKCNVSPYAGARVATIVAMKFSKKRTTQQSLTLLPTGIKIDTHILLSLLAL